MEEMININDLRKVKGIGAKTIKRIKEQMRDDDYASEYNSNLHLEENSINLGDCLELMNGIPDKSVDMILADLPYGTTACSWDSIIDLDKLWLQYERIIKDDGAIVLTASHPFTGKLVMSNPELFRYEWVWEKNKPSNFMLANKQPMKYHENILVFYKKQTTYNKQMIERSEAGKKRIKYKNDRTQSEHYYLEKKDVKYNDNKNPSTIVGFKTPYQNTNKHPTQKPVKLFEYLIKTYTNKGDLILDNVAGSGTTGVACQRTNRDYILIEQDEGYYQKSLDRVAKLQTS